MINKEILGGLQLSLSKGISLKDAMMSFYNSSYEKQEIEQAAKELLKQEIQTKKQIPITKKVSDYGKPLDKKLKIKQEQKIKQPLKKIQEQKHQNLEKPIQKDILNKKPLIQKVSNYENQKAKKFSKKGTTTQKVSNYNPQQTKKTKGKIFIIILIIILIILVVSLIGLCLFKDKIVQILNLLLKNA